MRWRRFSVTAPPQASEAVSAILQQLFRGISIVTTPAGLVHQAYISEAADVEKTQAELEAGLRRIPPGLVAPATVTLEADWVDEQDWAEAWKEHYRPIRVGKRLVILPSWLSWPDPKSPLQPRPDDIVICIDPGMAFGTGAHAASQMCMVALENYLRPGDDVIDFGCGSGILTIAACKLGASTVLAIDNDPVCIKVTAENVVKNDVAERCEARLGESLAGVNGPRDLIVANVTGQVVAEQAANAATLLRPGGYYIISGFTSRSENDVTKAITAAKLAIADRYCEDEWWCWVTVKQATELS